MILNCLVIDDDKTQRELLNGYINETETLSLVGSFNSTIEGNNFIGGNPVDLIFLDVEMPIMNGLEFLKELNEQAKVVLVTSKEKYALESYNFDVIDFLLKPVSYSRFLQAVNKVKASMGSELVTQNTQEDIFVKVGSAIEKVELKNILFIEAAVDYVQIVTSTKKYLVNTSMGAILAKLPKKDFIRVHRSHIVRVDKITRIDGSLIVINDKLISTGKTYKDDVMKRINLI